MKISSKSKGAISNFFNLSFGLSSSDSEEFAPQILEFSAEVNGQRPFTRQKRTRDASKVPENEREKPKTQVFNNFFHWFIWILAVAFFFYEFLIRVAPSVMIDSIINEFHEDAAVIGATIAIYFYIYAPMQLPVGLLMDKLGPRYLLSGAAAICGIGTLLFGMAPNLPILGMGRFFSGLGSSFAFVGLIYITSTWFPKNKMSLLFGIATSVAMIGAFSGEGPFSVVENVFGWRLSISVLGILGLILSLFLSLLIFKAPKKKKTKKNISFFQALISLKQVLTHPLSWINALIAMMMYATTGTFAALWGVSYLMNNHHLTREQAGFASSTIYLGWLVGGPIIGYLSDKWKKRRPFLKVCSFMGGLCFLLLLFWPNSPFTLILTLLFLIGLFSAAELLNFSYAIDLHLKGARGSAIAFTNFSTMVIGAFLQPFVGWLLDSLWDGTYHNGVMIYSQSDYTIAMLCFPATFFIAFLLSFFLKEKGDPKNRLNFL